ncbi:MAG: YlbF family regulator [Lachnospiraceae bacterium]|nr:YlbF family regulator [Lachnospiraceae bacterium]
METEVLKETDVLIHRIVSSDIYKEYRESLEKVAQYPELKEKLDRFRTRNYEVQVSMEEGSTFESLDDLDREKRQLTQNPLLAEFLAAELALCRMMQEVMDRLVASLDFE